MAQAIRPRRETRWQAVSAVQKPKGKFNEDAGAGASSKIEGTPGSRLNRIDAGWIQSIYGLKKNVDIKIRLQL
jgi:hypothetical protein